jgi:hypothetical protein
MIRRPLLSLLVLACAAACAPAPVIQPMPWPTPSDMPSAEATPSAATPTPEPSCAAPLRREDGSAIYAAALAGYLAVKGLDVQSSGTLTEPLLTLRLAAYPGSSPITLKTASVVLAVNGTAIAPKSVPFDTVVLPPGPDASFGAVQTINLTLPANSLKGRFGSDPATAKVTATVTFKDDKGADVLNENLELLSIVVPLQTGTAQTPALDVTLRGCGE